MSREGKHIELIMNSNIISQSLVQLKALRGEAVYRWSWYVPVATPLATYLKTKDTKIIVKDS